MGIFETCGTEIAARVTILKLFCGMIFAFIEKGLAMNITDNYFDFRGCGDCIMLLIVIVFLIYGFFKYAIHKDRQNLETKKKGKE